MNGIGFSTSGVHPRDSISYWLEVATKAFVRHEFRSLDGPSFDGRIRAWSLDALGVSEFECDACVVERSARDVARGDSDDVLLCMQVSGTGQFDQDGRQATNRGGSFLLIDTRRPFSIAFPHRTRSITFKLPREPLEARLGSIAGLTARAISPQGSLGGLASGFLSLLPQRVATIEGAAAAGLAHNALDLVALATAHTLGGTNGPMSTIGSSALFRLKSVIEARLREPDLKPPAVAAAAGISVRYANALLSREGSSVERYIFHRRLERCREALADPMQRGRMISEIAYAWGFSDMSHFGRRFRAIFGMSASDYRRCAQDATRHGQCA